MSPRVTPVARRRVVAGALFALLCVCGLVLITEQLRHPHPGDEQADLGVTGDDPRVVVECADPEPREGRPRAGEGSQEPTVEVVSGDLYDCPETWDGRRVRLIGEVVGAVLRRADGAWLQLNDDIYAVDQGPLPGHRDYRGGNAGVGVFVPHHVADAVDFVGGPFTHGDHVEVVGRFLRVDPASTEAMVIRASDGSVVRTGAPFEDPPLRDRRIVAVLFACAASAMAATERLAARSRRLGQPLFSRRDGR